MNTGDESNSPAQASPLSEVERMIAEVTKPQAPSVAVETASPEEAPRIKPVQAYDFRNPMLLAPGQLRKLRLHQEEFANALAARLSLYLRLEFSMQLTSLETVAYAKLAQSWRNPSHLSLFKVEPLRGVSILEIPPTLGLCLVDRLMGGPGQAPEAPREMSEIETALLDQAVQLILGEWCLQWTKLKELKPVLLGFETNGKFIQTGLPETMMLVIGMEARIGSCAERIQIAFPYTSVEALIRQLTKSSEIPPDAPVTPVVKPAIRWNPCCDDLRIPLVAEWQGMELTAREILALKVGDILKLDGQAAQQVTVRLADNPKFLGRPGTIAGNWAVELTQPINR